MIERIFDLYLKGKSFQQIANIFNEENVLNKNWRDSHFEKIINNKLYMGDYEQYKRIHKKVKKEPVIYMNVIDAIIPRYVWEECQLQKEKNQRTYTRDRVYTFFQKIKCPTCGKIMKCKGSGGKKKKYMYYNCESCRFNIREDYIEKKFKEVIIDLIKFDETYNKYFLPLFAEKDNIDNEINELTKQKDRIKKAYTTGVIELIDFKEDLKVINEKLDYLNNKKEENIKNTKARNYSVEKIMVDRDLNKIFCNDERDKSFIFNEWNIKSKEEKQEFISRYIESITIEKNKESSLGIDITDIKLKSLYVEKVNKLTSIGASDAPIPVMINNISEIINISCAMTEKQLETYLNELLKNEFIKFYRIKDFEETFESALDKNITLDIGNNETIYKLIPILKNDPYSKEEKFNLGVLTTNKVEFI